MVSNASDARAEQNTQHRYSIIQKHLLVSDQNQIHFGRISSTDLLAIEDQSLWEDGIEWNRVRRVAVATSLHRNSAH